MLDRGRVRGNAPPKSQFKIWFKRIRLTLELTRTEVTEIMRLGGCPVSASRADGWMRPDTDIRRSTDMTEREFDAFTSGLVQWSKQD